MPSLTLRNIGHPMNRKPGFIAPAGTEVRGVGPQLTAAAGKAAAVVGAGHSVPTALEASHRGALVDSRRRRRHER